MKREEVRAIFPNATDEEVSAILNKMGEEINPLKTQLKDASSQLESTKTLLSESQASEASFKQQLDAAKAKLDEGMSAEEKLAQLEEAAKAREAEYMLKSNGLDAKEIFVGAGIFEADEVDKLVAQVTVGDAEATKTAAQLIVDTVTKQRAAVEAATKDALLKANPGLQGGGSGGKTVTTVKQFLELPYSEQLAMKEANPQILSQLTK